MRDVQRRVGDFGRDDQLGLLDLGLGLRDLHAGPGIRGVRGALADRVAQVQAQRPGRRGPAAEAAKRVEVAAGNRADDPAADVAGLTLDERAATALQVVVANQVESGQRGVPQVLQSDFVLFEAALGDRDVDAVGQRVSDRTLEIDRLGRRCRPIRR